MAKSKQTEPEKVTVVTIRAGASKEILETWRYWEIVCELQHVGADRLLVYDVAKALQKAKPGDRWEIQPGITLEVTEK